MSFEEEFDRLMREKAEGLDFPFEEAHWEKASKLIARNRGMGRATMLKVAAAIVAVGGLVTAVVLYSPEELHNGKAEVATVKAPEKTTQAVQPVQDNNISQAAEEKKPAQVNSSEINQVTTGEVTFSMNKRKVTPSVEAVSKKPVAEQSPESSATPAGQPVTPSEKTSTFNAPVSVGIAASGGQDKNKAPATPGEEAEQANTFVMNEQAEVLGSKPAFLEPGQQQREIIAQRLVVFKSPDYYKKSSAPIKFYLDLYAGGAYQNGWESGPAKDGAGMSWYGGVSAGYFLTKNFSVGSGLQAYNIGNIELPFYTVYSTSYDFSSVTTRTVISCPNLLYLAVPLQFSYHFGEGHSLRAGIYASQLIKASTTVESSTILDNEAINKTTIQTNAVYDGMTQQVFMASAGYNMKVGKRVYVNAELVYGLNAIFSPDAYGGVNAKPAALRLGIAYRMLER